MRSRLTVTIVILSTVLLFAETPPSADSDNLLTQLTEIQRQVEQAEKKMRERRAVESDNKSKWTSIPVEFGEFVWRDPQSFYTFVTAGALEMVVYGIAWKRMRLNVATWTNEIAILKELSKAPFDLVRIEGGEPQKTSFLTLFKEWSRAEKGLGQALTQLSKDEFDLWQSQVSDRVRRIALKTRSVVDSGGDSPGDAAGTKTPSLEEAVSRHSNAYENLRLAMEKQRVVEIVKASSRREIPKLKSVEDIFKDAGSASSELPIGEGKSIALSGSPAARALQLELTVNALRNVRSSASRALTRTGKWWRRASLPLLLVAIPVTSIYISRYHDALVDEENRIVQGEFARKNGRDRYVEAMIDILPKPLLAMFVAAWTNHPKLRFYKCPFQKSPGGEGFDHSLNVVSGVAYLSILELSSEGKELSKKSDGTEVLTSEFMERFFSKMVNLSRGENSGLNLIPQAVWEGQIIPELAASGPGYFGVLPEVAKPQSVKPIEPGDSEDDGFSLKR